MKYFLSFFAFFAFAQLVSQDSITYFPQEQVVLEGIENNNEPNIFLYQYLENKTHNFLNRTKTNKALQEFKKDTLKVRGTLVFNNKLKVDTNKSNFSLGNKKLNKKFDEKFESLLFDIPVNNIIHRKPYLSKHFFKFNYILNNTSEKVNLTLIENKRPYTGGIISEAPRFPGCEGLDEKSARSCFQLKIQQHIKANFNYPKEAKKQKIAGRVSVIFIISKEGEVINIRTRGPHPILEEDVVRIIKLLPKLTPGKQNGKPVKVPFSIPITYKLR